MPPVPLLKALTEAGVGSRRRVADAIKQGKVTVNGELAEGFNYPVDVVKDRVVVEGQTVELKPQRTVYLILNKPKGVLSTTSDDQGHGTVTDILPFNYRHLRLHTAGRLDKDSTGLLLLTNDGRLTYEVTHPRFEHEKEYLVSIGTRLKKSEKQKLEQGVRLEDDMTHEAAVREVSSQPTFIYSITIHEGKKRQVRRMFASIGHRVLELKRVRIGGVSLGELEEGKVRELSPQEVRALLR
jgi:23S rRNA pseudouridine2605 synthase